MLPKEILPFYTHLAVDPAAPEVTVNLSTFYRDDDKPREFKYKTDQQGYSLLYSVGGGAQQTVEIFPPYRYTYGINRLQGSTSTDYTFNYPVQSDPVYSQATVGFADVVVAPESILERACGATASVSVTGLTSETLYIGNFINESRDVIFTSNPINLNVEGLLFLYVVRSRDGDVYQPGIDYTFDPVYQAITFNEPPELYTPVVVEIGVATLDGSFKVITANGTHSLPPAFSYGVAITGAEGTYSEFATNITWTSIIDDSEPNTNYVLALSDGSGCKTLASSGSNNVVITDVNALVHRTTFKDFTDSIRASTPVPVESTASLASTVAYEEVEIKSASVPGYNESRIVTFDQTVDNPVELASINTEAYSRAGAYENGIYRAGSIRSLPKALGVSEVEDSILVNNRVPATITPTFSLLVPANNSGFLARYELTDDMDLMNPVSAAWGLLLAASQRDSDVILLNLKALVYQAKQRGWITLENGVYVIDKTISAGLPIYFSVTDPDYEESFKEVGSNAFLGWAACLAVLSLTDDKLKTYYALQGSDSDFYFELLLTLEAMALFVTNGVSRVTWYAAYKEDASAYSYDQPSLSATIYADMFLSYFLALRYNSTVHYVAAKLDYNLSLLPGDLESPFYEQFYERDYAATQYTFEPAFLSELPEDLPEIKDYFKLTRIAARSFSNGLSGTNTLINQYTNTVDSLAITYPGRDFTSTFLNVSVTSSKSLLLKNILADPTSVDLISNIDNDTYIVPLLDMTSLGDETILSIKAAMAQLKTILVATVYGTQERANKYFKTPIEKDDERYMLWAAGDYRDNSDEQHKYLLLAFVDESNRQVGSDQTTDSSYHYIPRNVSVEPTGLWTQDYNTFINTYDYFEVFNYLIFSPTGSPSLPSEDAFNPHIQDVVNGNNGYPRMADYNFIAKPEYPEDATGQDYYLEIVNYIFEF